MRILIYDNSQAQWVAEFGFTSETLDAKAFDNATEARRFCERRADLYHHRIALVVFESTEVVLARDLTKIQTLSLFPR